MKLFKYYITYIILLVTLTGGFLAGCAPFFYVDLSPYPETKRTIYLQNFLNHTFQPDINVILTRNLRDEIHRRENFIIVNDRHKARFVLSGEVNVFRKEGRMYDNYQNPTRYEMVISARIRLRESGSDDEEQDSSAVGTNSHIADVTARLDYSDQEGYVESDSAAYDRLARKMASNINREIEKEFISRYPNP